MATFARGHSSRGAYAKNARTIEQRSSWGTAIPANHTAVDGWALRGLPALGPGIPGGAVRGSRPELDGLPREWNY